MAVLQQYRVTERQPDVMLQEVTICYFKTPLAHSIHTNAVCAPNIKFETTSLVKSIFVG